MQEVEGWAVEGHTDYLQLKGDTGPLVYPAGFLYVYRALRWLVGDAGRSAAAIRAAQWVFVGVYLFTLGVVLAIYGKARPGPPWLVLLLAASKRLHSLFMLRLFNDGATMALAYAAVLLFMTRRVRARRPCALCVSTLCEPSTCARACALAQRGCIASQFKCGAGSECFQLLSIPPTYPKHPLPALVHFMR